MSLADYLNTHYESHPSASMLLCELRRHLKSLLPAAEAKRWPNRRLCLELARLGYPVGTDRNSKRLMVGGLCRAGAAAWQVDGEGMLIRMPCEAAA